jgi:hypothetical protein
MPFLKKSWFAHEYRSPIVTGLVFDALAFLFAATITDSGPTGAIIGIAVIGSLVLKVIIPIRRPHAPSKVDLAWVQCGALFLIPIAIVFSAFYYR